MWVYLSQLTLETAKPSVACQPANQAPATMSTEASLVVVELEAVAVEEGTAVERTAGRFKRMNEEEKSVVRDHILTAQRRGRCRERMVVRRQGEIMLATRIYQRLAEKLMPSATC